MNRLPAKLSSRTLAAAIGCVLLVQVFLSAFAAGLALSRASIGELFVICHGDGGSTPGSGDENRKLPCSLCALAIGGGLPADPISVGAARLSGNEVAGCKERAAVITPAPARDGLSRAPPHRG